MYNQYVPTATSSSHTRGRSRSRYSPSAGIPMPSPQFPATANLPYYPSTPAGTLSDSSHRRHASVGPYPYPNQSPYTQAPGQTFYVARSPSRHGRHRSDSHRHHHPHHRSSSTNHGHSHRHSSRSRHGHTHRTSSSHRRSHSAHAPTRRYTVTGTSASRLHHSHTLSLGDRIRKFFNMGPWASHHGPKVHYVDARGNGLDRMGRPIVKY